MLLVDEDLEIARLAEIGLRREEGGAFDPLVAGLGHVGESHGEQCSADAVADRRHVAFAGRLFDGVERGEDAFAHIRFKPLVAMARVGVDPGDDEDREPLRHRVAHEAFLGTEVENVEFVDPRRNDQKRPLVDGLGRRRILDKFDEVVAEDDLARRHREVHADGEFRLVIAGDLEAALAGLKVFRQHRGPAHEVLAARTRAFHAALRDWWRRNSRAPARSKPGGYRIWPSRGRADRVRSSGR